MRRDWVHDYEDHSNGEEIQMDPWKSDDTNTVAVAYIDGDVDINKNVKLHQIMMKS